MSMTLSDARKLHEGLLKYAKEMRNKRSPFYEKDRTLRRDIDVAGAVIGEYVERATDRIQSAINAARGE